MSNPKTARIEAAEKNDTAEKTTQPVVRKYEPITANRVQDAEFARMQKVCVAHENVLPEDLLHSDYWAHIAQDLRPWTRIEVRANDGTWLWEGVVLEAGRNWANVRQLALFNFSNADIAQTNAAIQSEYAGMAYEVRYRGEFELWSVVRKSDNAVMHDKEGTKAGADLWLRERLKADRVT